MGTYKNKTYPLRIDNELQEKIKIIADRECRPVSKQYEKIIRDYINEYENQQGKIQVINMGDNNGTINMN